MKAKSLLRIGLLAFVAGSIVAIVVQERPQEQSAAETTDSAPDALPDSGLVVTYFHGETRCPTCRNIEAYAQEAIQLGFADALATGDVTWRVVNYEEPLHAHFVDEFEIVAPTVVITRRESGQQTAGQNLARVWELVGDKPAFVDYIQQETTHMLAGN